MNSQTIIKILKENISFSPQVEGYVIHGAAEKIMHEHYLILEKQDANFNHLVDVCNVLAKAACRHDLHVLNEWCEKYTKDDSTIDWRKIVDELTLVKDLKK